MNESTLLALPYILPSQAQKHVTHNEALRILDAIIHLSALDRGLTSPPVNPQNGDRYIVGQPATDLWAGHENEIAAYQDDAWIFYPPRAGWLAWVQDENQFYTFNGSNWIAAGSNSPSESIVLNTSPNGAQTRFEISEEELSLTGDFVESTILIPDRAIVFGVSTRTTQSITGASSYDCGTADEINRFGALLGTALGSSNSGVIGPTAFYADTKLRITANDSSFTAGSVRITIHYMICSVSN